MTGFGRGVAEQGGLRVTVDIRAVNHRFLDLKLRGAGLAPAVEEAVTARVRAVVERGSVAVSVHVDREHGGGTSTRIDRVAAGRAFTELSAVAAQLGLAPPDLALVLAQPGVQIASERTDDDPPVLPALEAALTQLQEMRAAEGVALAAELTQRIAELTALRTQIAMTAATVPHQLTRRLQDRLKRLLDPLLAADAGAASVPGARGGEVSVLDPVRIAQEIALLADRSDVTEELVRLVSHLDQATALIGGPGAVGRRLDFLVQEIGRELNTIGSKSTVTEISAAIVEAKATLEKVREQVQNVE